MILRIIFCCCLALCCVSCLEKAEERTVTGLCIRDDGKPFQGLYLFFDYEPGLGNPQIASITDEQGRFKTIIPALTSGAGVLWDAPRSCNEPECMPVFLDREYIFGQAGVSLAADNDVKLFIPRPSVIRFQISADTVFSDTLGIYRVAASTHVAYTFLESSKDYLNALMDREFSVEYYFSEPGVTKNYAVVPRNQSVHLKLIWIKNSIQRELDTTFVASDSLIHILK